MRIPKTKEDCAESGKAIPRYNPNIPEILIAPAKVSVAANFCGYTLSSFL
ncbi:MAG: hypothetical protein ACRCSF_05850 [Mycobacteriaceae bacterium]